jgi:hypothetical protein
MFIFELPKNNFKTIENKPIIRSLTIAIGQVKVILRYILLNAIKLGPMKRIILNIIKHKNN